MKKLVFALLVSISFIACQQPANTPAPSTSSATTGGSFSIAFVNVDSIMSSYDYAADLSATLEGKGKAKEEELKKKAAKFQRSVTSFQSKVQQHLITSTQAEKMQAQLVKQEQDLQALQGQMRQELSFQEREMLLMLNDSLKSALEEINKDGKYKMILRNSMVTGNVIVSTPDVDLTAQTIEVLNAKYTLAKKDSVK